MFSYNNIDFLQTSCWNITANYLQLQIDKWAVTC